MIFAGSACPVMEPIRLDTSHHAENIRSEAAGAWNRLVEHTYSVTHYCTKHISHKLNFELETVTERLHPFMLRGILRAKTMTFSAGR